MTENNILKIRDVESQFINTTDLVTSDRYYIKESIVSKHCRKELQKRKIILFNDILIIAKITDLKSSKKILYEPTYIDLCEIKVTDVSNSPGNENSFKIFTPKKSYILLAESREEKMCWMEALEEAHNKARQRSGFRGSLDTAPTWVPDSDAVLCMSCNLVKFNVFSRRHHCRKCGNVVCASCSKERIVIDHISRDPVRVCNSCYISNKNSQS